MNIIITSCVLKTPKMKCCVPLCKSTGDNHRITFNRFPATPEQRALWLQMLGLTESDLPPGAVVCSQHFKGNNFTVNQDGTLKRLENSIPLQFCMICLASGNSKMYPMNQNYLQKAYTTMTGIAVSDICDKINALPQLCAECAQRLVNCERLRHKSLRAHKSLMQILRNNKGLTLHNLKSINRVEKRLISNTAIHAFEPDHCDLYVKYNEDSKKHTEEEYSCDIKENIDMTIVKYEKNDATDFDLVNLNESDDFKNDFHVNNGNVVDCDDVKNAGVSNYDVQVKNTNINNNDNTNNCGAGTTDNVVQDINRDKFNEDDDVIINSDVNNVKNNVCDVFMISDSDNEGNSLEDDIKHDIDIDIDIDIDDDVDDGFEDNINYCHDNILSKTQNRTNIQNEDKVMNNVKHEISKSNNKKRPRVLAPKTNGGPTSSKSKIHNGSVQKPKRQKKPKQYVPKPKKWRFSEMFTKSTLTYEEQLSEIQSRKHSERYKSYPYKCDICFTGSWTLSTYNQHMEKHLDISGKWECAICGCRFKTRKRLITHLRSHAERYSCKRCEFVTVFSMLVKHSRRHSGQALNSPHSEAKFSNPRRNECNSNYKRVKSRRRGQDEKIPSIETNPTQTKNGSLCEICGKSFSNVTLLTQHKNLHSGVKPYKCDFCNKGYLHHTSLKMHIQVTHADSPKRYPCGVCHREFSLKMNRDRHMLIHDPSKRTVYTCDICTKSFTSMAAKVNHVAHVHNKVPWPKRHRPPPPRRARKRQQARDSDTDNTSSA